MFPLNLCWNLKALHYRSSLTLMFLLSVSLSSPLLHFLPSSQMRQHRYFAFAFLCSLLFPSLVRSLECLKTQYVETRDGGQTLCCDMCQPGKAARSKNTCCMSVWKAKCALMGAFLGHYLHKRCSNGSLTQCKPCDDGRYLHNYNEDFGCDFCQKCNDCEYFQLLLDRYSNY